MAQSPFQTSGDVSDIAPAQLKGGFTPAPGIVDVVADAASVIVPAIREDMEQDITSEVNRTTKAVSLALKATRFPSIQDSVFSEEALASPATQQALEEFTRIQDAVSQGRLPSTFALERLELAQNNAIKDAPEFEQEIRGAMRDAMGIDPQKALVAKLFSDTARAKTPQQKQQEKDIMEAQSMGITVEQLIKSKHSAWEMGVKQQRYDFAASEGTYTLQTAGSEIRDRGALIFTDTLQTMRQIQMSGQDFNPDTVQALKNKINTAMAAVSTGMMSKTAGLNISGTALQNEMAPLKLMQETMFRMLDDGSMKTMVNERMDVTMAGIQQNILNMPEYAVAYAIDGGRGFQNFLEFSAKAGNTAEGKALAGLLNPKAKIAFDLQGVTSQYGKIGNNEQLETQEERTARVVAAGVYLSGDGTEEVQIAALEDIKRHGSPAIAWAAFDSNKVLSTTAKSNKLKAAFINMQVTTTAGLTENLVTLAQSPDTQLERMELTPAGLLIIQPRPLGESVLLSQTAKTADADMQEYADRFNRASRISAKYAGAGVLPAARYESPASYWNTVSGAAKDMVAVPAPKVIKWGRDENGKPIRLGDN